MTQKRQITITTIVLTAVIGSLLITAMVIANTLWAARQSRIATNEAVSAVSSFYLQAMADRRAKTITNLISEDFDEMEKAVAFIEDEKVDSQEELRNIIGKLKSLLNLNRFALVDEDNVVYTQYTTYTGGSRHAFLSEETVEGRIVSTVTVYGSSRQLCLVIPISGLTIMGKPMKACFVQYDLNEIVNLIAFNDHDRTRFALYSKNGDNLSDTELGSVFARHNFFDALKGVVSEDVWKENYEHFDHASEGSLTIDSNGAEETLCYVPVEDTGWMIAALIRESVIQNQIRDISDRNLRISRNQIVFTMVAVLIFAAIVLLLVRRFSKNQLEEEKRTSRTFRNMATTDSQTGVKNKHAYAEHEALLNEQIQAGELEKLAVVVGDINGLKYVNDTQGHAAGDQLIKDACALICEYFKQGNVFRVGGDEFVVLLQDEGYDTMPETIGELNRKVEANIKEHAVVVSIGYDMLTKEDKRLRDVFERADKMMYERKKELKSMGAPTGRV